MADSIATTTDYLTTSKHRSLYNGSYYPDTLLMVNKRKYHYFRDADGRVLEYRQTEVLSRPAVELATGKRDTLYSSYGSIRTFCLYDEDNNLTGVLNQRCQIPFDQAAQRFDSSKVELYGSEVYSCLHLKYAKDTVLVLTPAHRSPGAQQNILFSQISSGNIYNMLIDDTVHTYSYYKVAWKKVYDEIAPHDIHGTEENPNYTTRKCYAILSCSPEQHRYRVGFYEGSVCIKEIVFDENLERLYSVSVFDNAVYVLPSSDDDYHPHDFITSHYCGGIGVTFDGYIDNLPVSVTFCNYRIQYCTGEKVEYYIRSGPFETVQDRMKPIDPNVSKINIPALPESATCFSNKQFKQLTSNILSVYIEPGNLLRKSFYNGPFNDNYPTRTTTPMSDSTLPLNQVSITTFDNHRMTHFNWNNGMMKFIRARDYTEHVDTSYYSIFYSTAGFTLFSNKSLSK